MSRTCDKACKGNLGMKIRQDNQILTLPYLGRLFKCIPQMGKTLYRAFKDGTPMNSDISIDETVSRCGYCLGVQCVLIRILYLLTLLLPAIHPKIIHCTDFRDPKMDMWKACQNSVVLISRQRVVSLIMFARECRFRSHP